MPDKNQTYKDIDRAVDKIKEIVDELEHENEELTERLRTFDEAEEIKKRDEEITDLYRRSLLVMSDKELHSEREFRSKHYAIHNGGKFKSIGNTYIYTISGTGLGATIKIKCPVYGEEADITDYGSW